VLRESPTIAGWVATWRRPPIPNVATGRFWPDFGRVDPGHPASGVRLGSCRDLTDGEQRHGNTFTVCFNINLCHAGALIGDMV
jgi:hypothetical protein